MSKIIISTEYDAAEDFITARIRSADSGMPIADVHIQSGTIAGASVSTDFDLNFERDSLPVSEVRFIANVLDALWDASTEDTEIIMCPDEDVHATLH